MRYNKDIKLISVLHTQKADGTWAESETILPTFCNQMTIGTSAYMAARISGLHADAEVQLRSCEYSGQQRAELDGVEYTVERVLDTGEFTRLTLTKRASNE